MCTDIKHVTNLQIPPILLPTCRFTSVPAPFPAQNISDFITPKCILWNSSQGLQRLLTDATCNPCNGRCTVPSGLIQLRLLGLQSYLFIISVQACDHPSNYLSISLSAYLCIYASVCKTNQSVCHSIYLYWSYISPSVYRSMYLLFCIHCVHPLVWWFAAVTVGGLDQSGHHVQEMPHRPKTFLWIWTLPQKRNEEGDQK